MMRSSRNSVLAPIIGAYALLGILFSLLIPAWEAPDEPAHYNYVRQLADFNFPVMTDNDYDQAYQSEVIGADFDPSYSVEPFSYEDYQPPLYYLIQTPVYWISGGSLFAMRLFGVFLGALTLYFAYCVFTKTADFLGWGRAVPWLAVGFFAFLPQHLAIQSSMNNDSLAELLIAAGLLLLINQVTEWQAADQSDPRSDPIEWRLLPQSRNGRWLIFVLCLCLLTKVTAYLLILVVGVTIIFAHRWRWMAIVQKGFETFTVPFLAGCLWWGRNLWVYGWPDFLGIQAHDSAVVGQPTTAEWLAEFGAFEVGRRFVQTTFRSFWGQFGWMEVVMPPWVYTILAIFSGLALIGFIAHLITNRQKAEHPERSLTPLYVLLTTLFLLTLTLYLAYNVTFVQHQGRYFFSSLIPISIGVSIGIWFFIGQNRSLEKLPDFIWGYLLSAGLIGLNLLALFRFILPAL